MFMFWNFFCFMAEINNFSPSLSSIKQGDEKVTAVVLSTFVLVGLP